MLNFFLVEAYPKYCWGYQVSLGEQNQPLVATTGLSKGLNEIPV